MTAPESYAVAWALFHARCTADDAAPELIAEEWAKPEMRDFWLEQAQIALDAQALHRIETTTESEHQA